MFGSSAEGSRGQRPPVPEPDDSRIELSPEEINKDLYQLLQTTNVDMDYQVFCILADLMRNGVSPEAIFFFLTKAKRHSKLGRKIENLKRHKKGQLKDHKRREVITSPAGSVGLAESLQATDTKDQDQEKDL
jgi:hypothetical protein